MSKDLFLDYLTFQNFMSYGNDETRINFRSGRMTLVIGENVDITGGVSRNGAGKSGIVDGTSYVLTGKTLRGISGQKVIHKYARKNQSTTVELGFRKGDMTYHIERGENPSRLFLLGKMTDNPENIKTRDGRAFKYDMTRNKRDTNALIESIVGHDFLIAQYLWLNSTENTPYANLPESIKRDVTERLFGYTILTERADSLKEERLLLNKSVIEKQSELTANEAANRRVYDQIARLEGLSNRWIGDRDEEIRRLDGDEKTLLARKPDLITHDTEYETIVDTARADFIDNEFYKLIGGDIADPTTWVKAREWIQTVDARISEFLFQRGKQERSLQNQRRTDQQAMDQYNATVQEHTRSKMRIEKGLTDLIADRGRTESRILTLSEKLEEYSNSNEIGQCPTCGQEWAEHSEEKRNREIANITKEIEELGDLLDLSEKRQNDYVMDRERLESPVARPSSSNTSMYEEQIADLTAKIALEESAKEQANSILEVIEVLSRNRRQRDELGKKLAQWDTQMKAIEVERAQKVASQNPYPDQIDALKKTTLIDLKEARRELEESQILLENYTFLIELLTKKDSFLRKRIIENWLLRVNRKLYYYCQELHLPHHVRFDSEMNLLITHGTKEMDVGNLSRGERARLNLAVNFSFQDCFEAMNFHTNVLFIDELLDSGLDEYGAATAIEIIRKRAKNKHVFLITHRTDISDHIEDVAIVRKENDVSQLIWS